MANELRSADDKAFLRAILAQPADTAPRLVYADWLDDQATTLAQTAAEYLRNYLAFVAPQQTRPHDTNEDELRIGLWRSERQLPTWWLAIVELAPIELCAAWDNKPCPGRWEQLRPTRDPCVRSCDQCGQDVRYSRTLRIAAQVSVGGHPVVLPATLERHTDDLVWEIGWHLNDLED